MEGMAHTGLYQSRQDDRLAERGVSFTGHVYQFRLVFPWYA